MTSRRLVDLIGLPDLARQWASQWPASLAGGALVLLLGVAIGSAYHLGRSQSESSRVLMPPALLHASGSHGATNCAIATGKVSEDAEGIFILDYITGNLQCWVYYPRMGQFGAKFETNITAHLLPTKNPEYLMVTGDFSPVGAASNVRPGECFVYVADVKSGAFATYSVPWIRGADASGQPQMNQLVYVGGDQFRNPTGGGVAKKPPAAGKATKEELKEKEKAPANK